jgi:hypothetical protein
MDSISYAAITSVAMIPFKISVCPRKDREKCLRTDLTPNGLRLSASWFESRIATYQPAINCLTIPNVSTGALKTSPCFFDK